MWHCFGEAWTKLVLIMRELRKLSLVLAVSLSLPSVVLAASRGSEIVQVGSGGDEDGDGLDDELEEQLGTDPLEADSDSDGWGDLAELVDGTDPCDPGDCPRRSTETTPGTPAGSNALLRLRASELLQASRLPKRPPDSDVTTGSSASVRYYYLPGNAPKLAVEMTHVDLKAGTYLLLWRHRLSWNPLGSEQKYALSIRNDEGEVVAGWQTPSPVDLEWRHVGIPIQIKSKDAGRMLTVSLVPEIGQESEYQLADFVVVSAGLEADVDRDGFITDDERPAAGRPLRHWINDDDDLGECQERADVPGRPSGQADHAQPGIDGLRDLVDFIPINLNLARVARLLPPNQGFRYTLSNPDRAVQVALTGLTPATAGAIHRNPSLAAFGPSFDGAVSAAAIFKPDAQGRIEIPQAFVERIAERGHGVILLEGARATQKPLQIEISKDDHEVTKIAQPLTVTPVEAMYRHVSVCGASFEYSGQPSAPRKPARARQMGSPAGLPDAETLDRWVVMVHGYNVSGDDARGWHAETFKRLHVAGSNARFVGVTWNGDTGLDYHKAVYHAFQAGDALPRALGAIDESRTLVIAHSLGNIVACQAIQAGFTPARYFLLNAALPIEALAGWASSAGQAAQMTEELWRPYPRRLYAAEWAKSQPPGDQRRNYSWTNAFARVRTLGNATNCYSPGEDVTNCPGEMTSASVLATIWSGRAIDYGVWKTQELIKGVGWNRSLGAIAMERAQGGWGFNPAWRGRFIANGPNKAAGGHYERLTPGEASRLTAAQLQEDPFFVPFRESWLHQSRPARLSPLLDSPRVRQDLLARAIPAMSYAAGGSPIPTTGGSGPIRNFNLEAGGRREGLWPETGHSSPISSGRWLHSDFKNVALPFVYPLFAKMNSDASLR